MSTISGIIGLLATAFGSIIGIVLMLLFVLVFLSIPVIIFILIVRKNKNIENEYSTFYNRIASNPSDAAADELIAFHTKRICINEPMYWNKLRAVWFAFNESSNVTTAKKTQLKNFLMLKGLNMHHNDAQIIDNYKSV